MSVQVAVATLEAIAGSDTAPEALRLRAARVLIPQVRGTTAGSPQAQTFDELVQLATEVAEGAGQPEARITAAEVLILAEGG